MGYQSCRIISKEVIAEGSEFPIMFFRFAYSEGAERLEVKPWLGQSLKLFNNKTGRKYSPVEVDTEGFSLGVKIYEGGKMSEYLKNAKVGQEMWWRAKPAWKSTKERAPGGSHVGLLAMGIGITAVLPVLEAELRSEHASRVVLLYSNRTTKDEIWVDRLKALQAEHPSRFTFKRHLTREPARDTDVEENIEHSRLDEKVLQTYFGTWDPKQSLFYAVGSKQQKKAMYRALEVIGFDMDVCKLFSGDKKRKRSWFGC